MTDIWIDEHLPVLRAAVNGCNSDSHGVRAIDIATELGLSYERVELALRALEGDGLLTVTYMTGTAARIHDVSGRAQRIVGTWPSPEAAFDRILTRLERIAAMEGPEQQRARTTLAALNDAGDALGRAIGAAAIGEDQ